MKRRVILITIDCLRRDRLAIYGNKNNLTPNIDKFCTHSVIYNNCITNGPNTPPAFYSLFVSEIPGIYNFYTPLNLEKQTIAKILQNNKINTCGIHSNPYLGKDRNFHIGFNNFFDMYDKVESKKKKTRKILLSFSKIFNKEKKISKNEYKINENRNNNLNNNNNKLNLNVPYTNAKLTLDKTLSWLDKNYNSEFFLWIHFMDPHGPYYPPLEFIKKISNKQISNLDKLELRKWSIKMNNNPNLYNNIDNEKLENLKLLYNAEIHYLDHYIGKFFQYLKKLEIYNELDIILTADHGEAFLEHGSIGHIKSLYNELLRIPLIIKPHNYNKKKEVDALVQSIDIAPTILNMFHLKQDQEFKGSKILDLSIKKEIKNYSDYVISSVFQKYDDDKFFNDLVKKKYNYYLLISCRDNYWKIIYNEKLKNYEFYNLKIDPYEKNNLHQSDDENIRYMEEKFMKYLNLYINAYRSEENKIYRAVKKIRL